MDLRLLEYFLAVAKAGNITKAAEQLHVTQPTISRQLMDLEESLGISLLTRGKRQITLTDAGFLFQQRAQEIVDLMEKTERDLAEQKDLAGGTVVIGCVESCASWTLADVIKAFPPSIRRYTMRYIAPMGTTFGRSWIAAIWILAFWWNPWKQPSMTSYNCPAGRRGGLLCARMIRYRKRILSEKAKCSLSH